MATLTADVAVRHAWAWRELAVDRPTVRKPLSQDEEFRIDAERQKGLEAAIGSTSDFLPFWFLPLGGQRGRAVARIQVRVAGPVGREVIGTGTGFLVAPDLLLTNHHVLPDVETARESDVQFRYELSHDGEECVPDSWRLDPDRVFITSPFDALDFSLVALQPKGGKNAGEAHGVIPLRSSRSKIAVGERVQVIQHPAGRRKEVVLHESEISAFFQGGFLHYTADTLVGSSGAPVFNSQWDLVALHHRSVISRGADGKPIVVNGEYVCSANEGIRISAICEFLKSNAVPLASRAQVTPFVYP